MKKLYLFGLLVVFTQSVFSDELLTPDLYRRINYNVVRLIEKYESYCTFNGFNNEESFYSIFTNRAIIYNDYLPENKKQELTPKQYYDITQNEITKSKIAVEISDVKLINSLEPNGNNLYLSRVKLNKKVYFRNWNNFRYPDKSFVLNIEILVNLEKQDEITYLINKIYPDTPLEKFSIARIDLKDADLEIEPLQIEGQKLEVKEKENEATFLIPGIDNPSEALTIDSYDGYLKIKPDSAQKPDKNIFYVDVQHYYNDVGLKIQYNATDNYQFGNTKQIGDDLQNISRKTYGYAVGVEFDKKLGTIGRMNYFLNLGLGYEKNGIQFTGEYSKQDTINAYIATDKDGGQYKSLVAMKEIEENVNLNYLYVPVGGKLNYFLFNKISLESTLGLKLYFLVKQTSTLKKANADYKGYYFDNEKYDNLIMDHYYDFGPYTMSLQPPVALKLPVFNFGIYANVGANYRIYQQLSASFKIGYDYNFLNMADKNDKYNDDNNGGSYYISKYKNDYQSLIYAYDSIIKSNVNFIIGINYKF